MTLWESLTESERFQVKQNMRDYGGHFAGNLATAWMYADSHNERRIAAAFPDLIERFQPKNWSQYVSPDRQRTA